MKILKMLPFLSIILAVALSFGAVGALGEPAGIGVDRPIPQSNAQISVIGIAKAEKIEPVLDLDIIEQLISKNRVFDDFIYDSSAIIDEALFALIDEAETVNGVQAIKRETVDEFVTEIYGRKLALGSEAYYEVPDRGYTELSQHIVGAELNADGSVTVCACLNCGDDCESATVTYSLSPAANSYGYVIRSAEINE